MSSYYVGHAEEARRMAVLLRVSAAAEVLLNDGAVGPFREHLPTVEFVVRNAKTFVAWPPPILSTVEASLLHGREPLGALETDDVTLDGVTELERVMGPSLRFYAPLGGQLSKEFRVLLRNGLARLLTRQALQRLCDAKRQTHEDGSDVAGEFGTSLVDSGSNDGSMAPFFLIKKGPLNTELASVHWSPQSLQQCIHHVAVGSPQFTALIPTAMTLILCSGDWKASSMPRRPPAKGNLYASKKLCRILFTIERIAVVWQSIHDEFTADRLASILYGSYLKPAEQMREAGGEVLQAPLLHPQDAMDCYHRALALAQKGILYPYRHALRPPPSMEDRMEGAETDDIEDEIIYFFRDAASQEGQDIAPANRYLNLLLHLQRSTTVDFEENELYNNSLLAHERALFPRSHVLLHVWYALHRQAVVAAANAAHTLLLIKPSSTSSFDASSASGYNANILQQRQIQVARWCARAFDVLQRLLGWRNVVLPQGTEEDLVLRKEWLWLHTIKFKLLMRQAKLLRVAGSLEASHTVQEVMGEQLRIFPTQIQPLCCDEMGSVLRDVSNQLMQERVLLREEMNQKGGLILRL
ncbi:hypothetical protein TraAM80_03361 [Trypanosoma rangeli]|uniref:Uncharacterized protein n=1 Tax=Trypanosoma rangeli TaxID=5698 RepID=A0A422NPW5_TRYRA|nr:uncharacterized protein TraAM80_03361 [Trypanosoma rangeli]RNF07505.1 hypothetical protein TraAM80_03361 [Trypanosoma rangeli]|eukprot:RNF07505.1 hypothetical protein TraAM80_03361 [Trypanosoma rangeli]